MTYYHKSKQEAEAAGTPYASHFDVRAELEPYNGWVLVLTPLTYDVFTYPLLPILEVAEIDMAALARLRIRPANHKKPPAEAPKPARTPKPKEDEPAPTWKPGSALPWAK